MWSSVPPMPYSPRIPEHWAAAGHLSPVALLAWQRGRRTGTGTSLRPRRALGAGSRLSESISEMQHWNLFSRQAEETQGRAACAAGRDRSGQLDLAVGLDCRVTPPRLGSDEAAFLFPKSTAAKTCPAAGRGQLCLSVLSSA